MDVVVPMIQQLNCGHYLRSHSHFLPWINLFSFSTASTVMNCPTFVSTYAPLKVTTKSVNRNIRRPPRMMSSSKVHVGEVPSRLGTTLKQLSEAAVAQRGAFNVAISGGSLPRLLSEAIKEHDIAIDQWAAFLADERVVPLDHEDSNYREILSRIPSLKVIPIDPTLSPTDAANTYQQAVIDVLGDKPVFDAILLGLGPDGHTCSLFPDHPLV